MARLTESIPVRVDKETREEMECIADKLDVSLAWVVRRAIKEFLERKSADHEGNN